MEKILTGGKWLLLTKYVFRKLLVILVVCCTTLLANNNGRYAGSFTRMGLGARSLAMGNTGVAAPAQGYSFYYNPALAGMNEKKIFSNSYTGLSQGRHAYFLGFTTKIPPGAGLSLAWLKTGTEDFANYNSIGEQDGLINHSAHAIYGSFSRQFTNKFSIGITIKVLLEYITNHEFTYESTGVGADIGLYYRIDEALSLGLVYKDIGSKLKANTQEIFEFGGVTVDELPKLLRIGVFYKTPLDWLNVAYDIELSSKEEFTNHFGMEAIYEHMLFIRTGFMDFKGEEERGVQFFAGIGFSFNLYNYVSQLDYTFISSREAEGVSNLYSFEIYF